MKTRLIIVGTLILLLSITANAKIWRVNNNPGIDADFTTAQAAHDGASVGDTLFFEGSMENYGELIVSKKLIIIGPGYFLEKNENTQVSKLSAYLEHTSFMTGSDYSIITGMYILENYNINVLTDNITITRCKFGYIAIASDTKSANSTIISQCFIKDGGHQTFSLNGVANNLVFNNCLIIKGGFTPYPEDENHIIITNCYISCYVIVKGSYLANNIIKNTITGNVGNTEYNNLTSINESNYFTKDSTSPDLYYKLLGTSPALNAGKDGKDCGPSGGLNPYVLSGIPKGPHIYDATISTSANKEDGLDISIKIKTQL